MVSESQQIIANAIAYHGGDAYYHSDIGFGFRQKMFHVQISDGQFRYSREYADTLGRHKDVLTNSEYVAQINGVKQNLTPKDSAAGASSLNSVVYFALQPRFLSDAAVHSKLLNNETISGKEYYCIEVTFSEAGGGEDHDDVYLYWFDTTDYSVDYLAYSFRENDGGTRFRVANNSRRVNGILFQDYINYEGPQPDSLMSISELYRRGSIEKLSDINLDRLKVIHTNR